MSEAEKKRREDYKQNRKKWILIQSIAIALISMIVLGTAFAYYQINKTYYIDYTEKSNVDYSVQLTPNNFYEKEWIEKDKAYVSALIENIMAKFRYELDMDASVGIEYSYSYSVDAVLRIADKYSGAVIYEPVTVIVPEKSGTQNGGQKLVIKETVLVDYDEYNDKAVSFNRIYGLKNSDCTLVLTLRVNVTGSCEQFEGSSNNTYFTSLNFPLAVETAEPMVTASLSNGENKVLACESGVNKNLFLVIAIIFGILDVIALAIFIFFIYITRNEDINYTIKVQKIFKNYRSFIQQITNDFDTEGYQVLRVNTFTEMLSIRDTIQSPILMCENEDKTCTSFMVTTNTNILYTYEIKVDNYDEIYYEPVNTDELPDINTDELPDMNTDELPDTNTDELPEIVPDNDMEEETVILMENVDEEELAEAISAPSIPLSNIDYDMDDDEEEEEGVEIIGVVWPERPTHNKVYRYDPNGESVTNGDIVLVPSRDAAKNRDIIRKATVAHGNHKIDPEHLNHPLKKIIGIVKRKAETALMPKEDKEPQTNDTDTPDKA